MIRRSPSPKKKMYVFTAIEALQDWDDGHLVVLAKDKEHLKEVVHDRAHSNEDKIGTGHITHQVYEEVESILNDETADYRKPKVVENPDAVAFVGGA